MADPERLDELRRRDGAADERWSFALRLALLLAGLAVAAIVLFLLVDLLILVFAAILVALMLGAIADLVRHVLPVGRTPATAIAIVLVVALIGVFLWALGSQLRAQTADLIGRVPELYASAQQYVGVEEVEDWLSERLQGFTDYLPHIAGFTATALATMAYALLVLTAGVYLALRPDYYRNGLLLLFPPRVRERAGETLDLTARALRLWLLGQLVAMLFVGILVTLGLWILGVPQALVLGLIAGVFEFLPFIGPFLGAAPAVGLALAEDPSLALWVVGLFVVIQQIESNVITPLVQQRAVKLPAAVTVFTIVAFAILFGPIGAFLAAPLTVVCFVFVTKLWVRDSLGEPVPIPGEPDDDAAAKPVKPRRRRQTRTKVR